MDGDRKDLTKVPLIDVFSEDDVLILSSSSPGASTNPSGHSEANGSPMEYQAKCSMLVDQVPVPADSPEAERGTSCKYNLRKSLAWDSAFFTDEGVLDPEELADVNSTFRNVPTRMLPVIQEDARKSNESNTTLGSDGCVAASPEIDLFQDLHASIQNSQKKYDRDPSPAGSDSTMSPGKMDMIDSDSKIGSIANSAITNGHLSSPAKMEPSSISRKHALSVQCLGEISKETTIRSHVDANESRQKKQSLRATRTVSKLPIAPSRKHPASRGAQPKTKNEVLLVSSNVGNSQPATAKEKLISRASHNVTPKINTSIKMPGSSIKLHPIASSSSNNRSGGISCDRTGSAHLESRKKTSSRKSDRSTLESARIHPMRDSKSNREARNVSSTLKFSSSMSPYGSVDSLASESSSSSTSTVKKPTNSPTPLELSSYGTPHDNSGKVPKGVRVDMGSSGTQLLAGSSTFDSSRCCIPGSNAKEFKPSGLRLPSPKIGYFDAEKPLPHRSNRYSPECTQVSLNPKASRLKNCARTVEQRSGNLHLAASIDSDPPGLGKNTNLSQTKGTKSSSLLQPSKVSVVSGNVRKVRNHYESTELPKDSSRKVVQKIAFNSDNVEAEMLNVYQVFSTSAEGSKCENHLQSLSRNGITTGDDIMVTGDGSFEVPEKRENALAENSSSALHIQDGFAENKFHAASNHDEKENALPSEDQMKIRS